MVNPKILGGYFLDGGEDAFAAVEMHVRDARVQAEGVVTAAERPDVEIVNFLDALDGEDGAGDLFDLQFAGTALEEDVGGFAENADAGPEDEKADGEAEERIDPGEVRGVDDDRAGDDGDVGEGIAEVMDQDAAEIEVAAATDESEGDAAVDGEGGEGGPDHPGFDNLHGRAEALDGFVAEPEGEKDEEKGVGEGGQDAGAMIAVGFFGVGGAVGPAHGQPRDAEGGNVGEVVDGVVEEGDGMAEDAAEDFRDDQAEGGDHGPAQNGGPESGVRVAGMAVLVAKGVGMLVSGVVSMSGRRVIVGMRVHRLYSTHMGKSLQPLRAVIGQFDTYPQRID